MSCSQRHDDVTPAIKERLGGHDNALISFRRRCKSSIHLLFRVALRTWTEIPKALAVLAASFT